MKNKGFSLLELLLVIMIIGVIALIAVNSLGKSRINWTLKGEVNRTVSLIYQAKALASKDERIVRIRFDDPSNVRKYWLEENDTINKTYFPVLQNPVEVPAEAKIYLVPAYTEIYFYPEGKIMVSQGTSMQMDLVEIYVSLASNSNHYIKIRLYPLGAMETEKHFIY